MGLSLQTRLTQETKLSPAQILAVRLLELPSTDLQQRVNEELQKNPTLEEGPDQQIDQRVAGDDYPEGDDNDSPSVDTDQVAENDQRDDYSDNYDDDYDDDTMYYSRQSQSNGWNDYSEMPLVGGKTLGEYLKEQVYMTHMDKPQRHIAKWVLGNIDDDGFLRRTTEQLVDDYICQEGQNITDPEMEDIVNQIKRFDPPGVASYNLQECLITQLKQKPETETTLLAIDILNRCFDLFANRRFDKIIQRLDISEDQMREVINEITHLNQRPANAFTGNAAEENHRASIIPDFYVENQDGDLVLTLNTGDVPELHISKEYQDLYEECSSKRKGSKSNAEAARSIREYIDNATSFIDAIRQRNETLRRTMEAILKYQYDYFIEGDETFLKPMILQDIADRTGYDVSTISRVSNSKYVQTEWGVFPLKHFFSEAMENEDGDKVSTTEIKRILKETVDEEDKSCPMNDDQLVEAMKEKGYPIARRTIAKYREQLDIPVARLRKQLL